MISHRFQRCFSSRRPGHVLACTLSIVLFATAAEALEPMSISIDPDCPTSQDNIHLCASHLFCDTGQERLAQFVEVDGHQISVDVYMRDLHTNPGLCFLQVLTYGGAGVELGPLEPGVYDVRARMYMTQWPYTFEDNYFYLFDGGVFDFEVTPVPEPALLAMFVSMVALGAACRRV